MSNKNTTTTVLEDVSELLELVAEDRAESAGLATDFKDSWGGGMHILLDILLTDHWELALIKVAIATAEKRPDLQLNAQTIANLKKLIWPARRARCRHYVRRLADDEDGLDLAWLMLAANPLQAWTYGFLQRLCDHVLLKRGNTGHIEDALHGVLLQRFDRWEQIRDGFPAGRDDPFSAVTDAAWGKATAAHEERQRKDDLAAAVEARRRFTSHLAALSTPAQDDVQEVFPGVRVIAGEPKLAPPYRALAGSDTDLTMTPAILPVRNALRAEFPHAWSAIDTLLVDLREGEPLRWRPYLLLGSPGSGKSRLVRRMAELLSAPIRRFDGASSADNAFGGTPKRWSTALPSYPLTVIAETRVANPILLIDEIDKAGSGHFNGSLGMSLMPFLERETAGRYPDVGFECQCDLSWVNYALTANDDTKLEKPLRDRLRVIKVPTPGDAHIAGLAASIMRDLAVEMNLPAVFLPALAPDELAVIAKVWGSDGSVRKLQKIVRGTVTARDKSASRH